jgi:hypothetical protein
MYDHESAAAQVAGTRQGDGECEANRNRGINRVAAALKNLNANLRGASLLADDHPMGRDGRLGLRASGAGIDLGRLLREARWRQCQGDEAARQSEREPNTTHRQVRPCP